MKVRSWIRSIATSSNGRVASVRPSIALNSIALQLLLLGFLLLATGCQSFSIPRIDPTGQRIFLPDPYRVGLSDVLTHTDRNGQPTASGVFPTPSYQTPPTPPPCIDGNCAKGQEIDPIGGGCLADRGDRGQLLLTPTTIVAPVGGEVVLLAGICGTDGYLVTKEPIEWMLSPESVGTFLEVGDDAKGKKLREWHAKPKVEKLDVDFAKGRTSSTQTRITRGSRTTADDLILKKGQTWISLTSPSEGTSKVVALAPDSKIWDQRRQTATIYWVDAEWRFPEPQQVILPQLANLSTQVFKSEGSQAATGWQVIYRSLNPEFALFPSPSGGPPTEVFESVVQSDGRANATLQNIAGKNGAALVAIEVIRPQVERMRAIPLGKGQTIVTWSSANLQLDVGGPEFGVPGQRFTIAAILKNTGDLDAEGSQLRAVLPPGLQLVGTSPKATTETPNEALWNQGLIPAGKQLAVTIDVVSSGENDYRINFEAQGTTQPLISKVHNLRISQPRLVIDARPMDGVTDIEVGKEVTFNIELANQGGVAINNLRLRIEGESGFVEASQKQMVVDQRLGRLGVRQIRNVPVTFLVRNPGQLSATIKAYSDDALLGSQQIAVRGVSAAARVPSVSLTVEPVDGLASIGGNGGDRVVRFLIANNGDLPLTNLQLEIGWDKTLQPIAASDGINPLPDRDILLWTNAQAIQPRTNVGGELRVQFKSTVASGTGTIQARITTAQQVSDTKQITLTIGDGGAGGAGGGVFPGGGGGAGAGGGVFPGGAGGGGGAGPVLPGTSNFGSLEAKGSWSLDVVRDSESSKSGQPVRFTVRLKNGQNVPDSKVELKVEVVSDGTVLQSFQSLGMNLPNRLRNGNTIEIEPIRTARPGDTFQWQVTVLPTITQQASIRVRLTTNNQPDELTAESTVKILP